MTKKWILHTELSNEIHESFPEIDPIFLQLLWNRGLRTQEEIDVYVGPDWSRDVYSHLLFKNIQMAVERVFQSLEQGEVITIHGDYDADGVCGSAVLVSTLRDICRALSFQESKITSYIPHREKEGYSMSVPTIEHLHAHDHTKLIVTVDCGISNKSAIDRAKELGIDTIVCDHHTMPAELPNAAILIHPLVPGETYPNKFLCGTGVAFKLAVGLLYEARKKGAFIPEGHEKWLLDLVAIATVTDVMPLMGENRTLEHFGLLVLNKTKRKGLKKLLEISGASIGSLDTVSIGFQIGPRLNAAGRMTHASHALELLLEEDDVRAMTLATQLHEINIQRQKASDVMYAQAKQQLESAGSDHKLFVAVQEGWGAGLIGLVAGKLLSDVHAPVMVVGRDGEKFVGSGRSIEGFDITKALHAASEFLDKFGGHPQACGFSTTGEERFQKAVACMQQYADAEISYEQLNPFLSIDIKMNLEDVTWDLFDHLQNMRPFGPANSRPIFLTSDLRVVSFSSVGKDAKHLRLRLQSNNGKMLNAIAFGFGEWAARLTLGSSLDVVYEIDVNEWNGNRELQMKIVDLKLKASNVTKVTDVS